MSDTPSQQGSTPAPVPPKGQKPSAPHSRPGRDRPSQVTAVIGGMAVSFALHLSIIIAVGIGTITQAQAVEEEVEEKLAPFEPVELVRLGEKKPDNALPRIANPPPETIEEDVVNLAEPDPDKVVLEKKEPEKDPEKKREDRKKKMDDILKGLNNEFRPVNNETPEGDPDGVPEGTTSDIANKRLMNTYAAKVVRDISRQWSIPATINQEKAKELAGKVVVYIRVAEDGSIVSYQMRRKSGDGQFDISVERAIKAFMVRFGGRKLSMPVDESLKSLVVKKGLTLRNWEYVTR